MPTSREVEHLLTGPGGMFEVTTEQVRGIPMRVYRDRMRSLREVLALGRARGDAEDFLVYGDRRIGFATFCAEADRVARALAHRHGVGRGDRVAVLSANNPEWCLAFFAAVELGAVLVGLNGWWKADEILYGLEDCGAKVLVADGPRLSRVADRLSSVQGLEAVYVAGEDTGRATLPPGAWPQRPTTLPFAELVAGPEAWPGPGADPLALPVEEDDPAVIFYTSGTTGRPKGAVSTHRSMICNLQNTLYSAVATALVAGAEGMLSSSGQNVSLLTSPLFHVSGCHSGLVVGMAAGVRLVIPQGRFDPEVAMRLIERERVTVWATVPTMIWRVVEHPARHDYDLSSVTTVAYGGSPAATELQRRIEETFPNVRSQGNAYGLTETSSVATFNSGEDLRERPESVGRPLPVVEVRVVDENGAERSPGEVGEILVRGPLVMPGYWRNPEATAEVLSPDGWLRTGDLGYLDSDGYLYVTDRAKDMIIRGGENVYCVEIENRLVEHPGILEAAVIGVPHPTLGEEVKAIVRTRPDVALSAEEVRAWVAAALADFKVPAHVEFTAAPLPRNPSGKLLKNLLRGAGEVSFAETL